MPQIITLKDNGLTLSVRVQPGAKRSSFDGVWNDTHIKIALQAPAVDGKANDALIDFLSENLKIKKKEWQNLHFHSFLLLLFLYCVSSFLNIDIRIFNC